MNYTKRSLISEGKTKKLWATDVPAHAIAEFSDDAMMYHAKKKLSAGDLIRIAVAALAGAAVACLFFLL